MKVNWTCALWILLFVFGILYIIGTFFGNFSGEIKTWIEPSTDLWANLFASMIAIVIIERVISRVRLEKSQQELETILDRYNYLLDSKLVNDLFVLISVLRSYYDYHSKFPSRGYWNLVDAAQFSGIFISESKKMLEKHNLLKDMGTSISFRTGEPHQISLGRIGMSEQTLYNYYSELLEETISFRDECREKYLGN